MGCLAMMNPLKQAARCLVPNDFRLFARAMLLVGRMVTCPGCGRSFRQFVNGERPRFQK